MSSSRKKTGIVIVPPVYLVKMFGAPEMVRMPAKCGQTVEFSSHGRVFKVKKLRGSSGDFVLSCLEHDSRARFGTAEEIAEDIGRVLETGRIPHGAGVC